MVIAGIIIVDGTVFVGSEKPHLISPDHWNLISLFFPCGLSPYVGTCL